jgi:hypothetical protein
MSLHKIRGTTELISNAPDENPKRSLGKALVVKLKSKKRNEWSSTPRLKGGGL